MDYDEMRKDIRMGFLRTPFVGVKHKPVPKPFDGKPRKLGSYEAYCKMHNIQPSWTVEGEKRTGGRHER